MSYAKFKCCGAILAAFGFRAFSVAPTLYLFIDDSMYHDGAEEVGRDSNPVDLLSWLLHFLGDQLEQRVHLAGGHPVGLVRRVPGVNVIKLFSSSLTATQNALKDL